MMNIAAAGCYDTNTRGSLLLSTVRVSKILSPSQNMFVYMYMLVQNVHMLSHGPTQGAEKPKMRVSLR